MAKCKTPVTINTEKARKWDMRERITLDNSYAASRVWQYETKRNERALTEDMKLAIWHSISGR